MVKTKRDFLRVAVLADMHCGSFGGLWPPSAHGQSKDKNIDEMQRKAWRFYAKAINALKPIDRLIILGDAVHGRDERGGGLTLQELNRAHQKDLAAECIRYAEVDPKDIYIFKGTPSHVASGGMGIAIESWEDELADILGVPRDPRGIKKNVFIKRQISFNGTVFDLRHFVGGSSIPHGRATPLERERIWKVLESVHTGGVQEIPDVILRAHQHCYQFAGSQIGEYETLAMVVPALCLPIEEYALAKLSGVAHFGLVSFDIYGPHDYTVDAQLMQMKTTALTPLVG